MAGWRGEGDRFPMYYVNHAEATEFCGKLTDEEWRAGRLPKDWEYRLPTEAQWEYACRAGTTTRFSFGDDESDLVMYGWFTVNSGGAAHEVGLKRPNAWGLHDMHGNVWEWCRDWYYDTLPGGADPEMKKMATDRVLRGGHWGNGGGECRSASRARYDPAAREWSIAFRVTAVQTSK